MEELKILLEECVCEKLIHMTASGARDKDGISKVRIRPVLQKGSLMFQSAARKGKQEFHSNRDRDELIGDVMKFMEEDFRQLQIQMQDELITVLISKKGKVTIKRKKSVTKLDAPVLMHNRKKHYILEEGIPVPFLIDLGVQTAEGRIVHARYDKFRQINRFLEFIDMEHTPKNILIRAVKTGKPHEIKELDACEKFLGVDPLLGRLRKEKGEM